MCLARMEEDRFSLTANDRYYGSITGPGELNFYFADTAEEAAALYDNKTVDLVWPLTDEEIERQAEVTPLTELGTYTVLFNCNQSVFADQQVRQAMVMVIDRNAAAEAAGITAGRRGIGAARRPRRGGGGFPHRCGAAGQRSRRLCRAVCPGPSGAGAGRV